MAPQQAECAAPQPIGPPPGLKHAVVLVHGWNGGPDSMTVLRDAVLKTGRAAVYTFDYHAYRNNWAADDVIAGCLAVFIDAVARASKAQPAKVFVVGHSMGGLATRYASALTVGDRQVGQVIAGLVALDTPHLGSHWGGTGYADLLTSIFGPRSGDGAPLPDPSKNGAVCLARHEPVSATPKSGSGGFPSQCGPLPPYLPETSAVFQISGQVWVERTFLGVRLYRYSLDGDSVVDTSSELGYIGSGPTPAPGTKVRYGPVEMAQVECTDNTARIVDAAASMSAHVLSLTIRAVSIIGDDAVMTNILSDTVGPVYAALLAVTNQVTGCSHSKITKNAEAVKAAVGKLTTWFDMADNPMFAYTGPDGLAVARGTKTVYRTGGEDCGALGNFYDDPIWTDDGRYVSSVWSRCEDDGLGPPDVRDNVVLTIDTRNGAKRQVTCGCSAITAVGGSRIGWIDDRGRGYTLDLFGPAKATPWTIRMPAGLYARQVLADAGGTVLIRASSRAAGTQGFAAQPDDVAGAIVAIPPGGDVKILKRFDNLASVTAAAGGTTGTGPRFVFGTIDDFGDCAHPGPVWLFDPAGAQVQTDTSAIAKGGEVFLDDVWWSAGGQVMATLSSSVCDPMGGKVATQPSLWRLDGHKWVSVDRGPLDSVRQLSPSFKAVITSSGDLYVERNGKGTRVARGVYAISVPDLGS